MGHWECCSLHLLLPLLLMLWGAALGKQTLTTTDWLSSGCQTSRNPQLLFNGRTKPVLWHPKARVTNMTISHRDPKPLHFEPGLPSNSQHRGFNPSELLLVGAQKREPLTFIIRCYKITSQKNLPLLHPWNLTKVIFESLTQHSFSHWWDLSVSPRIKCSDSNGYAFPVEIVSCFFNANFFILSIWCHKPLFGLS